MITPRELDLLLPLAVIWAEQQEHCIIENGVRLTPSQESDARMIPVINPEKVRLLKVNEIPLPNEPSLRKAAQMMRLITENTMGMTLRYGIFVRANFWDNRKLIAHELVHVAQYEKFGGINHFLKKYLYECMTIGYPQAPLEQEAVIISNKIVGAST